MGGCICTKQKIVVIKPILSSIDSGNNRYSKIIDKEKICEDNEKVEESVKKKQNKFYCIEVKPWIIILDFLPRKDLYSVGKVSKSFNTISKSKDILTKFFRNNKNQDKKKIEIFKSQDETQAAINNLAKNVAANQNKNFSFSDYDFIKIVTSNNFPF